MPKASESLDVNADIVLYVCLSPSLGYRRWPCEISRFPPSVGVSEEYCKRRKVDRFLRLTHSLALRGAHEGFRGVSLSLVEAPRRLRDGSTIDRGSYTQSPVSG